MAASAGKHCCMGSMLVCCQALGFPLHCRSSPHALPAAMGAATFGDRVPYEFQASFIPGLQLEQPVGWCHVGCQLRSLSEAPFRMGFLRLHSGLLPLEPKASFRGEGFEWILSAYTAVQRQGDGDPLWCSDSLSLYYSQDKMKYTHRLIMIILMY